MGSSPLTRGKDTGELIKSGTRRIIPAYAGKRNLSSFSSEGYWDHPRLRGEKKGISLAELLPPDHPRLRGEKSSHKVGAWSGSRSSPLTRGKVIVVNRFSWFCKIIPAYAGKRLKKVIKSF